MYNNLSLKGVWAYLQEWAYRWELKITVFKQEHSCCWIM